MAPKGLAPTVVAPSGVTPEMLMVHDMDDDVSSTIQEGHILGVPF